MRELGVLKVGSVGWVPGTLRSGLSRWLGHSGEPGKDMAGQRAEALLPSCPSLRSPVHGNTLAHEDHVCLSPEAPGNDLALTEPQAAPHLQSQVSSRG